MDFAEPSGKEPSDEDLQAGNLTEALRSEVASGPPIANEPGEVKSRRTTDIEEVPLRRAAIGSHGSGCEEYNHLRDEFGRAVEDLLRLHEEQLTAIVEGDTESNRFDLLIHMANEKKQEAKYAYLRHVESHGCSNFDAINKTGTGSNYG
jgi:hypothetical protein